MDYLNYNFSDGRKIRVGTMYCVGQNYSKHAKEMGSVIADEPIIFLKPPAAYTPDKGVVKLPPISQMVHHEVELVAVIGKEAKNVKREVAHNYIAGYAVGLDITLRDLQKKAKDEGKPWAVTKGFYSSAPISTVIPATEFKENLPRFDIELKVNGVTKQKTNTEEMEKQLDILIEYLSNIFTLREGDCIFTGTPEGVGQIVHGDKLNAYLTGFAQLEVIVD